MLLSSYLLIFHHYAFIVTEIIFLVNKRISLSYIPFTPILNFSFLEHKSHYLSHFLKHQLSYFARLID